MKKLFLYVTLVTAILMSSVAFADLIVGGGAWQGGWVANENGTPYWDNLSWDVPGGNIGYYISDAGAYVGGSGPGVILPYYGLAGGAADPNFYFNNPGGSSAAAIKLEVAGLANSNSFGWYEWDVNNIITTHQLFSGPQSLGAMASFTPTANYGYYLTSVRGTFYTESNRNVSDANNQHFAVFEEGTSFWIGVEDLLYGSPDNTDKDFNDFVVKVTPVPEPATMLLLGAGLVGLAGFGKRKFFKKG